MFCVELWQFERLKGPVPDPLRRETIRAAIF
jgi:hypothetical protein